MKKPLQLGILFFVCLGLWFGWHEWKQGEPKRVAAAELAHLQQDMAAPGNSFLDDLVLPPNVRNLTLAEQSEFVRKALQDEITGEGLRLLKSKGKFGSLKDMFPAEAAKWAGQAQVRAEDCVAFKMDQNGLRTEVVLVKAGNSFRIVRCNNVKELTLATTFRQAKQ